MKGFTIDIKIGYECENTLHPSKSPTPSPKEKKESGEEPRLQDPLGVQIGKIKNCFPEVG